jgi:hypothetical protein
LVGDAAFGVHVLFLAADVRLVNLHRVFGVAAEFSLPGLHHLPDAVQHEPSRLLSDPNCLGHLVGADPVLAIGQHPEGHHPLVETDRGILENRPNLEGELLLAGVAVPDSPGLDEGMVLPTAPGAGNDPIRPTQVQSVLESTVRVGEENYRLLQCLRAVHDLNVRLKCLCVNYIITEVTSPDSIICIAT